MPITKYSSGYRGERGFKGLRIVDHKPAGVKPSVGMLGRRLSSKGWKVKISKPRAVGKGMGHFVSVRGRTHSGRSVSGVFDAHKGGAGWHIGKGYLAIKPRTAKQRAASRANLRKSAAKRRASRRRK